MDNREGNSGEGSELHRCLSDFTRLYGNVMTTKLLCTCVAPLFSCSELCVCIWASALGLRRLKKKKNPSRCNWWWESGGGGGGQEIISPLCKAYWRNWWRKGGGPSGSVHSWRNLCGLSCFNTDWESSVWGQLTLFQEGQLVSRLLYACFVLDRRGRGLKGWGLVGGRVLFCAFVLLFFNKKIKNKN